MRVHPGRCPCSHHLRGFPSPAALNFPRQLLRQPWPTAALITGAWGQRNVTQHVQQHASHLRGCPWQGLQVVQALPASWCVTSSVCLALGFCCHLSHDVRLRCTSCDKKHEAQAQNQCASTTRTLQPQLPAPLPLQALLCSVRPVPHFTHPDAGHYRC